MRDWTKHVVTAGNEANPRPPRWLVAIRFARNKVRNVYRRTRRKIRQRTGVQAPPAWVIGRDHEAIMAAAAKLRKTKWISVRHAETLPKTNAEGLVGVGEPPKLKVTVVPVADHPRLTDELAMRRSAVLLDGSPPDDLDSAIWPSATEDSDLKSEATALVSQPELRDRVAHRQRRDALDRGFVPGLVRDPRVSIVCATNRPDELDNVFDNARRQVGVSTQLVLVTHGFSASAARLRKFRADNPGIDVVATEADKSLTLGSCLNLGIDRADGTDIVKMDDDNYYGAHFLVDLARDLQLSKAGVTGKRAHFVHLKASDALVLRFAESENSWAHMVQGGTMYFNGDLLRANRFADIPRAVDTDILARLTDQGVRVYSSDRFNFVSVRGVDPNAHTWKVADATMLTPNGRLITYGDPRPHCEV